MDNPNPSRLHVTGAGQIQRLPHLVTYRVLADALARADIRDPDGKAWEIAEALTAEGWEIVRRDGR